MGCCIAVALMIAWVRRAWFAVRLGASPVDPGFAPVARRAGPGEALRAAAVPASGAVSVRPDAPGIPRRRPSPAGRTLLGRTALLAAATTVAGYAALVALGRSLGAVEPLGTPVPWVVRDLALVLLAGAALLRARRAPVAPSGARTGPVLIGAGAAWTVLGLLDMHLLAPFVVAGGAPADLLFHGAGSVAMLAGVAVEVRRSSGAGRRTEAVR